MSYCCNFELMRNIAICYDEQFYLLFFNELHILIILHILRSVTLHCAFVLKLLYFHYEEIVINKLF